MSMPQQLQDALLSYALGNVIHPSYELRISSWNELTKLGKQNIEEISHIIKSRSNYRDMDDNEQNFIREISHFLLDLAKTPEYMPLLPQFRDKNYFSVGNRAVAFFPEGTPDIGFKIGSFIEGKITEIKPAVSPVIYSADFIPDKEFTTSRYIEGLSLSFIIEDPSIMTKTDFELLKKEPEFTKIWLKNLQKYFVRVGYKEKLEELVNQRH